MRSLSIALSIALLAVACGLDEEGLSPTDAGTGTGGSLGGTSGSGVGGAAGNAGSGGQSGSAGAAGNGGLGGGAGAGGAGGGAGAPGAGGTAGSAGSAGSAGAGGTAPVPTCEELYGTVLYLIQICPSSPGQCKLAIDTDPDDGNPGDSCTDLCASKGAVCLKLWDNAGDFCSEDLGDERDCGDETMSEAVCLCSHPA